MTNCGEPYEISSDLINVQRINFIKIKDIN